MIDHASPAPVAASDSEDVIALIKSLIADQMTTWEILDALIVEHVSLLEANRAPGQPDSPAIARFKNYHAWLAMQESPKVARARLGAPHEPLGPADHGHCMAKAAAVGELLGLRPKRAEKPDA